MIDTQQHTHLSYPRPVEYEQPSPDHCQSARQMPPPESLPLHSRTPKNEALEHIPLARGPYGVHTLSMAQSPRHIPYLQLASFPCMMMHLKYAIVVFDNVPRRQNPHRPCTWSRKRLERSRFSTSFRASWCFLLYLVCVFKRSVPGVYMHG